MRFYLYRSIVIRNLAIATDDESKLPGAADLKWQCFAEFDEGDQVRVAHLRDDCLERAKELIEQRGFVQLAPAAGIEEP